MLADYIPITVVKIIGSILLVFILLFLLVEVSHKDYYVIRDNCLYHFTQEFNGVNIDGNYTLVTCNKEEFKNYAIKNF